MGQYTASHQLAAATAKPKLCVVSDGNVLPEFTYIEIACYATPQDYNFDFSVKHCTTSGTGGSSVTPQKNGPAASSSCTAKGGTFSTTDPTTAGFAYVKPTVYMRQRWCIQKPIGEGFRAPSPTSGHGLSIWCDTAGTSSITFNYVMQYVE